jgi:hypothetical protein
MTSIEFITFLLAIVAAITGGAYQLAKSNYHYFCGMHMAINPILIFLCGFLFGLQFSPFVENWKANLIATAIAMGTVIFCLSTVKDITKPGK